MPMIDVNLRFRTLVKGMWIFFFYLRSLNLHKVNILIRIFSGLILSLLVGFSSYAQKEVGASRMDHPPVIDGYVTENAWMMADSAINFIQMEPFKDQPATEKTVVYTGYDNTNLYFGFKCYHSNPATIVANIHTRDLLTKNDDIVLVLLDTYSDNRTALGFFVNPVGSQIDMKVIDDGRNLDINWDTEWEAASAITSWGWSVEIAIPFSGISYNNKLGTWGVNFGRIIRKNSETVYWSGALNDDFRVSQGGLLTGIRVPGQKHAFEITPYTTLRYEDSDISGKYNELIPDAGIDFAYKYSSNLKINGTYNPDFATVEGDQEQLNLTRWELSFPEKRLFFLEGNELFKTRINTFYSRRIGDIVYGTKATGKIKGYNFYLMEARSREDTANDILAANYSAMRVKKDIFESSNIGISFIDKRWEDGFTNSLSLDYMLNLGKSWKLTGQWVSSFPGNFRKGSAYFIRVARESNIYHYHIRYSDTGEEFKDNVNETGFIRDDDMRELDSDLTYKWWFNSTVFKYLSLGSNNNIFWNHQGVLRSWYLTGRARLYLHNRFSIDLSYNDEFKLYDKHYYNHKYMAEVGFNTDEWASGYLNYSRGKNYDRDFVLYTAGAKFKPVKKISVDYSFNRLSFSPDTTNASTFINILTVDYNFTRDLWIRLLAQNNSSEERLYFYGLFGWRFKPPFGAVYLIYTSDQFMEPLISEEQKSRIIYFKLSYNFGFPVKKRSEIRN